MNYKEPGLGMFGLPNFRYNSVQLSEVTLGRDNNFNLIRMFAALAVLVSHSFPLAIGRGAEDPLARNLGMSLGSIAVDTFSSPADSLLPLACSLERIFLNLSWREHYGYIPRYGPC